MFIELNLLLGLIVALITFLIVKLCRIRLAPDSLEKFKKFNIFVIIFTFSFIEPTNWWSHVQAIIVGLCIGLSGIGKVEE